MDADMYGIIPKAKIEAFAKAPPVKALRIPKRPPPSDLEERSDNASESTPGRTT